MSRLATDFPPDDAIFRLLAQFPSRLFAQTAVTLHVTSQARGEYKQRHSRREKFFTNLKIFLIFSRKKRIPDDTTTHDVSISEREPRGKSQNRIYLICNLKGHGGKQILCNLIGSSLKVNSDYTSVS